MTSNIDPTKPTDDMAYTADVRNNFTAAKTEIESLQSNSISVFGGVMNGPLEMSGETFISFGASESILNNAPVSLTITDPGSAEFVVRARGLSITPDPINWPEAITVGKDYVGNAIQQPGDLSIQFYSGGGIAPNIGAMNWTAWNDQGPFGIRLDNATSSVEVHGKSFTSNAPFYINANGPSIQSGANAPTFIAASGSLWIRTNGTTGNRIYINQDGASAWLPIPGV